MTFNIVARMIFHRTIKIKVLQNGRRKFEFLGIASAQAGNTKLIFA